MKKIVGSFAFRWIVVLSLCVCAHGTGAVERGGATGARDSTVVVLVGNAKIGLSATLERSAIRWPGRFLLSASAVMGRPITGCRVDATVEGPDGSVVPLPLSDRGTSDDGGEYGGLYQAKFDDFGAGNGPYRFSVTFDCFQESARLVSGGPPGIGPFPDGPAVPGFRQTLHVSGTLEGAPESPLRPR